MIIQFDAFYRAVLQQAWAEGRDIRYGIRHGLLRPSQPQAELLQAAVRLPWRHWHPEELDRGGGQWLVHRTTRNPAIFQRLTQGWYGAELALRHCLGHPPNPRALWLPVMAHWHLYNRYSVTAPDLKTADALRSLVVTHPAECQLSRGEQWILHRSDDTSDQWCQVNDRRIFLTFNEFGIYGSDSPVSSVTSPFDARRFTDGPKGSRGLGLDGPGVKGSYPIRRAHERGITGSSEKPAYGLLWQSLLKWSAKPISEERLSDVHQSPTHFSTDR